MRRKKDSEMVQTAVRLPQSLRDRLTKAGSERGMSEEIRRRLEASLNAEKASANPKTRELLDAIFYFDEETTIYYGDWSQNAFAFEVLKDCVDMLLTHYQPKGEPVAHPSDSAKIIFGLDHSLKDISRAFVTAWISNRARRELADQQKG